MVVEHSPLAVISLDHLRLLYYDSSALASALICGTEQEGVRIPRFLLLLSGSQLVAAFNRAMDLRAAPWRFFCLLATIEASCSQNLGRASFLPLRARTPSLLN